MSRILRTQPSNDTNTRATISSVPTSKSSWMPYSYARRSNVLRGLTPYKFICRASPWVPEQFRLSPSHHAPGLNAYKS